MVRRMDSMPAAAWHTARGIKIERGLTDSGACYASRKFREACREFGIQHKMPRPYRPQTNGKAERFIQTALKEWAYAQTYTHSWKRAAYLSQWTHHYNIRASPFGSWQKTSSFMPERRVNNVLTLYI